LHYEIAALSLGDVLRSQKNYAEAVLTYEQVNEASQPDPEVLQKANLAAGEMYDLLAKRDLAVKRYQAVVAVNSTTTLAENANRYLKELYRGVSCCRLLIPSAARESARWTLPAEPAGLPR
jgi:tetratricopeptide (TPR) repeat protein